jgi:hypothetical protein
VFRDTWISKVDGGIHIDYPFTYLPRYYGICVLICTRAATIGVQCGQLGSALRDLPSTQLYYLPTNIPPYIGT